MPVVVAPHQLEHAIRNVYCELASKKTVSQQWNAMSEKDLWREMVACILGSRVRYDIACAAMDRMDQCNLFSSPFRSSGFQDYEAQVMSALSGEHQEESAPSTPRYPFSRMRAGQIHASATTIFSKGGSMKSYLSRESEPKATRRRLSNEVAGLGPKQASLFLRNIGFAEQVAVLDVHVLTYMHWIGLTPGLVKSVSTIHQYEKLEDSFINHSVSEGFSPGHFDLAVWVVVRVAKKECVSWQ